MSTNALSAAYTRSVRHIDTRAAALSQSSNSRDHNARRSITVAVDDAKQGQPLIQNGAAHSKGGAHGRSFTSTHRGIPPAEVDAALRTTRVKNGSVVGYAGIRRGLVLGKKIVERYGGPIWVESQPGHGGAFHFTLPALPVLRENAT